jgi:hypothetical protein
MLNTSTDGKDILHFGPIFLGAFLGGETNGKIASAKNIVVPEQLEKAIGEDYFDKRDAGKIVGHEIAESYKFGLLLNAKYYSSHIPYYTESQDLYNQAHEFAISLEESPITDLVLISKEGPIQKRVNGSYQKVNAWNLRTNKKPYGQKKTFFGNRPVKNTFLTHYYGRLIKY